MTNIELGYSLLAVILLMSLLTLVIIINVLVMKKEGYRQEERFDKIVKSVNDYEEYIKNEVSKGILNIIDRIEVLDNKDKAKKPVVEKVNIVDELFEDKPVKAKAKQKAVVTVIEEHKIEDKIEK
jgi:phosphoribulokinase